MVVKDIPSRFGRNWRTFNFQKTNQKCWKAKKISRDKYLKPIWANLERFEIFQNVVNFGQMVKDILAFCPKLTNFSVFEKLIKNTQKRKKIVLINVWSHFEHIQIVFEIFKKSSMFAKMVYLIILAKINDFFKISKTV